MSQITITQLQPINQKQVKQLLWINKILKYPYGNESDLQTELPKIICSLSQEFLNHRNNLRVSLLTCNQGSSHKKCKNLFIVKVTLSQIGVGEQAQIQDSQANEIGKKSSGSNMSNESEDNLISHIISKMRNHKGQLHCPFLDCPRHFSEAGNLKTHIRTHLPDRVFKCQHEDCGKTFKLKQHLKHHEGSHQNINRFVCNYLNCQKSFSRASRLELHIKSAHSGQNLFECNIPDCGKIFAEKGNLLVHMRTHTGEKPYNCKFCDKKFTTIGNCKDHERRHTQDKPYQCKLCPVKYYRKYQLVKHLSTKHPNAIPTDINDFEDDIDNESNYQESFLSSDQSMIFYQENKEEKKLSDSNYATDNAHKRMKLNDTNIDGCSLKSLQSIQSSELSQKGDDFTPQKTIQFDFEQESQFLTLSRKTTFDTYFDSLQTTIKGDNEDFEGSQKLNFNLDFNEIIQLDFQENDDFLFFRSTSFDQQSI